MRKTSFSTIALFIAAMAAAQDPPPSDELSELTLEELMNVEVVSASNVSEKLSEAPATVIVVTAEQIRERGYSEMSQILDDLPGMDIVRPWGDTYFKNYWRGYRNTVGDPFLVMIDGVVFNHLYFNTGDVLATFPLSSVDRVEVVYGPASSVYGASAFMGVINVITRRNELRGGTYQTVTLAGGSSSTRIVDASLRYKGSELTLTLAARLDNGELGAEVGEKYEYTKNRYYADRRLWGGFVDNPNTGGSFSSPHRNRGFDLRAQLGDFEAALQYFRLDAGYGVEYAGDRAQNHAVWARPDLSAYLRFSRELSSKVRGATLVRYRASDVSNDSYFVEAVDNARRTADFSYWHAHNSSLGVTQDFDLSVRPDLVLRAGARYEQKDLQKAYDVNYGPTLPVGQIDGATYPYPPNPATAKQTQNRITTEDVGVYVQSWYKLRDEHRLNFGIRSDHNSKYGGATTVRTGYTASVGKWGFKALYGEAFQEPNNRLLYGGWDGSGSDPRLRPERSRTMEVSASRTQRGSSHLLSVYAVRNRDTFVNTADGAFNLGEREVFGLDYHLQALIPWRSNQLKVWGYVSHIFSAEESATDGGEQRIGDLADNKLQVGATYVDGRVTATLRGRYVGSRPTVETNPIRRVGSFATADLFIRLDDLYASGVGLSVSVTNLTDRTYYHPGIRDANAGEIPGRFDSDGLWHGSGGFFNSLMAQPGRSVVVSMHLDLPGKK